MTCGGGLPTTEPSTGVGAAVAVAELLEAAVELCEATVGLCEATLGLCDDLDGVFVDGVFVDDVTIVIVPVWEAVDGDGGALEVVADALPELCPVATLLDEAADVDPVVAVLDAADVDVAPGPWADVAELEPAAEPAVWVTVTVLAVPPHAPTASASARAQMSLRGADTGEGGADIGGA